MIAPEVARNAIAVYGVVIAGGGIGAFLRSGSKPSVISGVAAGIVLAAAYVKDSVPIALATALALAVVFAIRLVKTKKFMPAGMLAVVSVLAAAFFAAAIYA
ncbi:Transmembrane protein 14C [Gracilaria domingensis]|nr:Transmembrane protein 14C [Gracilaria domingensis]